MLLPKELIKQLAKELALHPNTLKAIEDVTEWARYEERLKAWQGADHRDDIERAMLKPNPPGYYRANND
jgi:Mg2+ and Co2+ transporter CorA